MTTNYPSWISIVPAAHPKYEVTSIVYLDETKSGGRHNLYVTVLDKNGSPVSGAPVWQKWPDARPDEVCQYTLAGSTDFGLYGGPFYPDQGETGAYWTYVESPAVCPTVKGMGLPADRHVCYSVTFKELSPTEPTPDPTPTPTPEGEPARDLVIRVLEVALAEARK